MVCLWCKTAVGANNGHFIYVLRVNICADLDPTLVETSTKEWRSRVKRFSGWTSHRIMATGVCEYWQRKWSNLDHVVERDFFDLLCSFPHLPMILPLQETTSWDLDNMFVCVSFLNVANNCHHSFLILLRFVMCRSRCASEKGVQQFSSAQWWSSASMPRTLPQTSSNTNSACRIWWRCCREEARRKQKLLYTENGNIDSGFSCMDEDHEMKEIFGPQCWSGIDADRGRCKVWRSALWRCDDWQDKTFTHNAWNKDGRLSHLDWRFEEYDRFMQELMKVMTEGPNGWPKRFFRALDLNTEWGYSCAWTTTTMRWRRFMSRNVVGWFRGRLGRFQKSDVDGNYEGSQFVWAGTSIKKKLSHTKVEHPKRKVTQLDCILGPRGAR